MNKVIGIIILLALILTTFSPYAVADTQYNFADVDGNGAISASDALLVLQCSVKKITLSADQLEAADVDLNGSVTAGDALLILQCAVGKITLTKPVDYNEYKYKYVEPTGLESGKLYNINIPTMVQGAKAINYDYTRLAVCIQGLVNRNFDKHKVAIEIISDSTDAFWLSYITGEEKTYSGLETVNITTTEDMLNLFKPFLLQYGIIAWDENVPSTSNVASTICGLYNYIPVAYDTTEGSLYQVLKDTYNVPVKMSLVGMFEGAKIGTKIGDTNLDSTGSPKCDAYIWAMDKYMSQCNLQWLAYTLDGAGSVEGNPVYSLSNNSNAAVNGIPNHDYFIAKQCFFFDLTPYALEAPNDEPTQPIGADADTYKKILQKRYDLAGSNFGVIIGFVPWHLKYSTSSGNKDMEPSRLEWLSIELVSSYNMTLEPDAAHPCWMTNASLYANYKRIVEPKGNAEAKAVTFDPDTYYYTICYTGDFDCSPWLKWRVPTVWNDTKRGTVDMAYCYNVNLVDRVPMIYDYIFENQTPSDYILSEEGLGYTSIDGLFKGFEGREANIKYAVNTLYPRNESANVTRALPDGDKMYVNYAKPYFQNLKVDVCGSIINGFTPITAKALSVLNQLSTKGSFLQIATAGANSIQICDGVPYAEYFPVLGDTLSDRAMWLRSKMITQKKTQKSNFTAIGYSNIGMNPGTPSGISAFEKAFDDYMTLHDPDKKYQCVDVYTFLDLIKQSGQGVQIKDE